MTTETATPVDTAPATTPMTRSSWFMGSHTPVPLTVAGQTLTIRREISALTANQLYNGLALGGDVGVTALWQEYGIRKAAAFLMAWSLPNELSATVSERETVLRSMRRGPFERLYDAIAGHEQEQVQRYFEGVRYSPSAWAARVATNDALSAEQRVTLPAFDTLPLIIAPDVSIAADAWFVPEDDSITLQLPDGHWMRIRSELTQGQFVAMVANEPAPEKDATPSAFARWAGARKLAAYLLDWSMVYPDGVTKAPPVRDSIAELDASKFEVMFATIEAYEALLKKERETNPTFAQ